MDLPPAWLLWLLPLWPACPAPSVAGFRVLGVARAFDGRFAWDAVAASAAPPAGCGAAPDDNDLVPFTFTVECPVEAALSWDALPLTATLAPVNNPQEEVLRRAVRSHVPAEARAAGGVTEVAVGPGVAAEAFLVRCGGAEEALLVTRPSLGTLRRIARQWPAARVGAPPPPNVVVLLVDAVSRAMFHRRMPRTAAVLEGARARGGGDGAPEREGALALEYMRFHSVDSHSGPCTVPLFTGGADGAPGNETLSELFRRSAGYVTAFTEGSCELWSVTYNKYAEVVDHDAQAAMCLPAVYPLENAFGPMRGPYSITRRCLGSRDVHSALFDHARDFWGVYAAVPKYLQLVLFDGHEGSGMLIATADAALARMLEWLLHAAPGGEDTLLLVLADHGLHMGVGPLYFAQGDLETRAPLAVLVLPARGAGPYVTGAMRAAAAGNRQALVSSRDFHWTLRELAARVAAVRAIPRGGGGTCGAMDAPDVRGARAGRSAPLVRGSAVSLWEPVPEARSCGEAGVNGGQWCMCV